MLYFLNFFSFDGNLKTFETLLAAEDPFQKVPHQGSLTSDLVCPAYNVFPNETTLSYHLILPLEEHMTSGIIQAPHGLSELCMMGFFINILVLVTARYTCVTYL